MSWSDLEGSLLKKATGGAGVGVRSCGGRNCKAVAMHIVWHHTEGSAKG